ncbi:hypothetical protein EZV62_004354 [Acer yangbiense]|uniref:Uncharacterized protein n=1 Tax=Acer yangbiense TaxID=1000413 RepID=A0A5C7IK06_9ROSI|nr:hypothetical protein EZV62_004354 [Acer yangbiense]
MEMQSLSVNNSVDLVRILYSLMESAFIAQESLLCLLCLLPEDFVKREDIGDQFLHAGEELDVAREDKDVAEDVVERSDT